MYSAQIRSSRTFLQKQIPSSKSGATYHLSTDPGNKSTAAYSTKGFDSYLIGKDGSVLGIVDGIKHDRPTAKELLVKARKLLEAEALPK